MFPFNLHKGFITINFINHGLIKAPLSIQDPHWLFASFGFNKSSVFISKEKIRNGLGSWSASAENLNLNQNNSNQSSLLFLPARTGEVDSKKVNLTEASTNSKRILQALSIIILLARLALQTVLISRKDAPVLCYAPHDIFRTEFFSKKRLIRLTLQFLLHQMQ